MSTPMLQLALEVLERDRSGLGRGDLDAQRQPVEPSADPTDPRQVRLRQVVTSGCGGRTVPEQANGRRVVADAWSSGDTSQTRSPGTPSRSWLVAMTVQSRRLLQQIGDERGHGIQHVLAVVEDEEVVAGADPLDDLLGDGPPGDVAAPGRLRRRLAARRARSVTTDRSTCTTSPRSSARRLTTSAASLVLPTPPGPMSGDETVAGALVRRA